MNEIPGLLPPMSGLDDEQRGRLAILRQHAVDLGLMHERDARYHHDDERAMSPTYVKCEYPGCTQEFTCRVSWFETSDEFPLGRDRWHWVCDEHAVKMTVRKIEGLVAP